jgi:hypothetical protein
MMSAHRKQPIARKLSICAQYLHITFWFFMGYPPGETDAIADWFVAVFGAQLMIGTLSSGKDRRRKGARSFQLL